MSQPNVQPVNISVKPVYIMNQEGVSPLEKQAVLDGAKELIRLTGVDLTVKDFGHWRSPNFKNADGTLKRYHSVEWYLSEGMRVARNEGKIPQIDGDYPLTLLSIEPWRFPNQGGHNHYDILVLKSDMYSKDTNFVIGLAKAYIGTVLSVARFQELDEQMRYECIKTETIHELGHGFGLIPQSRTVNVETSIGKHCTNVCIMRQGLRVPKDWIALTEDRLKYGALCKTCEKDLKEFFR
jgi:hypothetical protein